METSDCPKPLTPAGDISSRRAAASTLVLNLAVPPAVAAAFKFKRYYCMGLGSETEHLGARRGLNLSGRDGLCGCEDALANAQYLGLGKSFGIPEATPSRETR
jgi:hypothetical protein